MMPPLREVVAHQAGEQILPGRIERRGRLVEQPDRPPHREQPGDREPPPLAGGQIGRRQMRGVAEADCSEGLLAIFGVAAEKIPPERQVLQHAQRRLQRVAMAEIVRLFGQRQLGLAAFQIDRSGRRHEQARDQPQQRGFAGSVGAGDGQRLAGGGLEIEAGKHLAAAPHTPDTASREPHFAPSQPSENYGYRIRIFGWRMLQHDCRCGGASRKIL